MKEILVEPRFLADEICGILVGVLMEFSHRGYLSRNVANRVEVPAWEVALAGRSDAAWALRQACELCTTAVRKHFSIGEETFPEFLMLQANYPGDAHVAHSDNSKFEEGRWVPNHTPYRTYSAAMYLNDFGLHYTGGELVFPYRGEVFAPKRGMLVAFPSDHRFVHEVKPVSNGVRYSILLWFTNQESRRARPL